LQTLIIVIDKLLFTEKSVSVVGDTFPISR